MLEQRRLDININHLLSPIIHNPFACVYVSTVAIQGSFLILTMGVLTVQQNIVSRKMTGLKNTNITGSHFSFQIVKSKLQCYALCSQLEKCKGASVTKDTSSSYLCTLHDANNYFKMAHDTRSDVVQKGKYNRDA